MPTHRRPSLLLGFFLNLLWPGVGQIYFRKLKKGLLFALLGLFLPFIMFIVSCIDLYFLNKQLIQRIPSEEASAEGFHLPEWDIPWEKTFQVVSIIVLVLIFVYSVYFISFFLFMAHFRQNKIQTTIQEMQIIKQSLEDELKKEGTCPDSLESLVKGRPLRRLWLKDAWGMPYRYVKRDSAFELISSGKDKKFNTEDDLSVSGP